MNKKIVNKFGTFLSTYYRFILLDWKFPALIPLKNRYCEEQISWLPHVKLQQDP